MTAAELIAARVLVEAATPGPWTLDESSRFRGAVSATIGGIRRQVAGADGQAAAVDMRGSTHDVLEANAAFIAASRTLVPALIAEVERLRRTWNPLHVDEIGPIREIVAPIAGPSCRRCHGDGFDRCQCLDPEPMRTLLTERDLTTTEQGWLRGELAHRDQAHVATVERLTKERDAARVQADEIHASRVAVGDKLAACRKDLAETHAIIAAHLPHPNGPGDTTPGDVDAWNAAMHGLGEMRRERDEARALLPTETERQALTALNRWIVRHGPSFDENPENRAASDYLDRLLAAKVTP